MSRGVIYHIAADPNALGGMCADDFAEHVESLNVDYVEDQDEDDARVSTDWLFAELAKAGFNPKEPDDGLLEDAEDVRFLFESGDEAALKEAKMNWFRSDLEALRKLVASAELEPFATDTALAYKMKELAGDDNADAVYLDMGYGPSTYTLASFIRNMEAGRTYYVGTETVYMH